ncbi:MAG TPA: hypothetical protein VFG20_19250 [Planctomycetaceae bacterium]|jgi:hypothetical protein|nr:hypothetical protein [Planctomycetaceae bacterium]
MPDRPIELDRFDAVSECGEHFTICHTLHVSRCDLAGKQIGANVRNIFMTNTGLNVQRVDLDTFAVMYGARSFEVRRTTPAAAADTASAT